MKKCTKCGKIKLYSEFYYCKRNPDGLDYYCKHCKNESVKESYHRLGKKPMSDLYKAGNIIFY